MHLSVHLKWITVIIQQHYVVVFSDVRSSEDVKRDNRQKLGFWMVKIEICFCVSRLYSATTPPLSCLDGKIKTLNYMQLNM